MFSFLVFVLSFVFLVLLHGDYSASNAKLEKIRNAYHALAEVYPSPTEENINLSETNTQNLQEILLKKKTSLIAENNILPNNNRITGIEVLAKIQGFLVDFEEASTYLDPFGVEKEIEILENEAFGFAEFAGSNTVAPSDENAPKLDLQLGILRYILTQLYAAQPFSIEAVEREAAIKLDNDKIDPSSKPTRNVSRKTRKSKKLPKKMEDIFQIDPVITAEVPGSIETMGFKVIFSGHTNSLREFLGRIAKFEIPLVIRDISVKPKLIGKENDENNPSNRFKASPKDNPFNKLFNVLDKSNKESSDETFNPSSIIQKPLISNNESIFTVVLEYIELATEIPERVEKNKVQEF